MKLPRDGNSRFVFFCILLIALFSIVVVIVNPVSIVERSGSKVTLGHPRKEPTVFGISDSDLTGEVPQAQASQLASMKSIGITSIRVDANWAYIQPNRPTSYSWTSVDKEIHSIRSAGMAVDLVIDGCPAWAAVPGAEHYVFAQPASTAQYATFAADVARRYSAQGVSDFEIWNEQNQQGFWRPKPNPAAYTKDLVAAYAAIKKVDSSAVVIAGGLSPAADNGINYTPATFLEAMYADGAKGSFDVVSDHPYSYPASPGSYEPWSAWSQMSQTTPSVRGVMVSNGDSNKQIWITEFGAPSDGPRGIGAAAQAMQLSQAIAYAKTVSWIGALYIYTWQDRVKGSHNSNGFGLINENGSRKPAFYEVRSILMGGSGG